MSDDAANPHHLIGQLESLLSDPSLQHYGVEAAVEKAREAIDTHALTRGWPTFDWATGRARPE